MYRFSRSAIQNFLRQSAIVANIFKDSELSSKEFLATPAQKIMHEDLI